MTRRVRKSPGKNTQHSQAGESANTGIPVCKGAKKTLKNPRDINHIAAVESEQPAPAKMANTNVSKGKRQRELDDGATVESEQVVPAKKARTTLKNPTRTQKLFRRSPLHGGRIELAPKLQPQLRLRKGSDELRMKLLLIMPGQTQKRSGRKNLLKKIIVLWCRLT
jgi:hypothetical protein